MGVGVITVNQGGAPMDGTASWSAWYKEPGSQGGGTASVIEYGDWTISDSSWAALDNGTNCGTTADTCNVERRRSREQTYNHYTFDGLRDCELDSLPVNGGNAGRCSSPDSHIGPGLDHQNDRPQFNTPRPNTDLTDEVQDKDVTNLAKVFTATYNLTQGITGGNQYVLSGFPSPQTGTQSSSYSFNHPTITAMDGFEFTSGPTFMSNPGSDSLSGNFSDRSDKTINVTVTGVIASSVTAPQIGSLGFPTVGDNSIRVNWSITGGDAPTTQLVEWGTSTSYGFSATVTPGTTQHTASGLIAGFTYHFRVTVSNSAGSNSRTGSQATTSPSFGCFEGTTTASFVSVTRCDGTTFFGASGETGCWQEGQGTVSYGFNLC